MKSNIDNTLHFTLLKANKNTWKYLSSMKVKHLGIGGHLTIFREFKDIGSNVTSLRLPKGVLPPPPSHQILYLSLQSLERDSQVTVISY